MADDKASHIEKSSFTDIANDAEGLAAMGHAQSLSRKFSTWSMFGLSFSILSTWGTFAVDLSNGLTNGGPITILYGLLLVAFCNLCVALSFGELCSSMPTALGQAYWVSRLWKSRLGRFLSYCCAWANLVGWLTLSASQNAFVTQMILATKMVAESNWPGMDLGWLKFVIYFGVTAFMTASNVVACRRDWILRWLNNFFGAWFGVLFVLFSLVLLISVGIKSDLTFQQPSFVFARWINNTGWSNGVTWFLGLVQSAYGLTAFDAVIHLIEEFPSPQENGPRVLWLSIVTGTVTGGLFMIVCLFCIQDLEKAADPPSGLPFVELLRQTIGSIGTIVLIAIFVTSLVGTGISITTTASRLTWGFARDGGLPFSNYLMHVDPYWRVPVRALWAQGALVALVGVLYLFTTTAVDAVVSASTVALTVSYGFPMLAVLVFGKSDIPPGRFSLGRWSPAANYVGLAYCGVTTVFFLFPGSPSPNSESMNYAVAVLGVTVVIAIIFWFTKGRHTYLRTETALGEINRAAREEAGM